MFNNSYTASERRGVIVIALIALLIMGIGAGVTLYNKSEGANERAPKVVEYPEMIDSVAVKEQKAEPSKKKTSKTKSVSKKSTSKSKKVYRRRSPLDEPV